MKKEINGVFYDGAVCPYCGRVLSISIEVVDEEGLLFFREKLVQCGKTKEGGCGNYFIAKPSLNVKVAKIGGWEDGSPAKLEKIH